MLDSHAYAFVYDTINMEIC